MKDLGWILQFFVQSNEFWVGDISVDITQLAIHILYTVQINLFMLRILLWNICFTMFAYCRSALPQCWQCEPYHAFIHFLCVFMQYPIIIHLFVLKLYNSTKSMYISYCVHKTVSNERSSSMAKKEELPTLFILCNTSFANETLHTSSSSSPSW